MASPRPEVIDAIQHFEDASGDPNAVSPKGAVGPMQIMPTTARLYGVDPDTLNDPKVNIPLGTRIYSDMLDRYHGNERAALIAYNQGTKSYDAGRIVPSAAQYAQNVLTRAGTVPPSSGAIDQAYTAQQQSQKDVSDAQAVLAAHPELLKVIQPEGDPTVGMKPPGSPGEAAQQQKTVEGSTGSEAAETTGDKAIDYAAGAPGTLVTSGLKLAGASPEHAELAGNITNAAMMGYSLAKGGVAAYKGIKGMLSAGEDVAAGAAEAAKPSGIVDAQGNPMASAAAVSSPAVAAEGGGAATTTTAASAPVTESPVPNGMTRLYRAEAPPVEGEAPSTQNEGLWFKAERADQPGGLTYHVDVPTDDLAKYKVGEAGYHVLPSEMASAAQALKPPDVSTPEAAASTLAQRQLDALKSVRVGTDTATEFGKPDIATTVPESLTMQESAALKQNLETYYAQGTTPPKMAAHVQALATTYQDEANAIHADNQALRTAAASGEDITQQHGQLVNRFAAFAENYSTLAGARSDTGRALQILNPNKPGNAFAAATARLAQQFSIEDNPEQLSDMLDKLKPEQFARVAGQMAEDVGKGRSLYNALNEYYVNNLLSNAGRTSSRIGTSNAISALLTIPRSSIEALIPGSPTQLGEPLARIQGMTDGFWHATDVALESLKTGGRESQIEGGSVSPFIDSQHAISGAAFGLDGTGLGTGLDYLGNVLRLPSRGLTAVHQFGHSIATSMETHALAWRDAVNTAQTEGVDGIEGYQRARSIYQSTLQNIPSDMRINASKAADVTTFANKLEGMPADAQKLLQYPVLKQLMPFFKVAYNVKKMGADITPGVGLLTNAPDLISGDAGARSAAAAKIAMGSMFGIAISHEFHQGNIVLDKYGSPQMKFGDKLVSVPEPLAFPLSMVGNYLQNRDAMSDSDAIDKAGAAAKALGSAMANDSIVQGLVNIKKLWTDIAEGKPKALQQFVGQEASGLVPWSALLRGISSATDPESRDPQTAGQEIQTGIPGESEGVQPRYDVFAKPVPNPAMGLPQRLLYPVNVTTQEKDPVVNEMARLSVNAAYPPKFLDSYPQAKMKWIQDRADGLHDDLASYVNDKGYKDDNDQAKKIEIEHILAQHTHIANIGMLDDPKIAAAIEAHKNALKGLPDELAAPGAAPATNEFGSTGPSTAVPAIQ